MVKIDFKTDTWLYALIAVILIIISIFTPWGSQELLGVTYYSWMGGSVTYAGDPADAWVAANPTGLSLWTFGITMLSLGILLVLGIQSMKGKELKWDWLIYLVLGLALLIFPILALALESVSGGVIGFAPIGIIISGVVLIIAFVMDKIVGPRSAA
ncbi:MAG: hypothetical protein ACFFDH_12985 [Promethearchaeota archaeon]